MKSPASSPRLEQRLHLAPTGKRKSSMSPSASAKATRHIDQSTKLAEQIVSALESKNLINTGQGGTSKPKVNQLLTDLLKSHLQANQSVSPREMKQRDHKGKQEHIEATAIHG